MKYSKNCNWCNQLFKTNRLNHKFCNIRCSQKYNYQPIMHTIVCKNCGSNFTASHKSRCYCSKSCYKQSHKVVQKHIKVKKVTKLKQDNRTILYERDGYLCYWCGIHILDLLGSSGTLDHIYPKSLGGRDTAANLVTCCGNCNNKKSSMVDIDKINNCLQDVLGRNKVFSIKSDLPVYFRRDRHS